MDYKKQYPGTVIGMVNKADPEFRGRLGELLRQVIEEIKKPWHLVLEDKIKAYGTAVSYSRQS